MPHVVVVRLVAICLLATIPTSAEAQDARKDPESYGTNSGRHWLPKCQQKVPTECVEFLDGVRIMHTVLTKTFFCPPQSATVDHFLAVVLKYLKDHPERLDEPFGSLVLFALREAYPPPSGVESPLRCSNNPN